MQRFKWFIITLCLPWLLWAEATEDPYDTIRYFVMENGLKVYLLTDPAAVNTRIKVSVNVGMDVETASNAGISHLVEHLVFRDQRIPKKDFLDYFLDNNASEVNGYTGRYRTNYVFGIPGEKSQWAVRNVAQMLFDKQWTEEDLRVEASALQTEIGDVQWYSPIGYGFRSIVKWLGYFYPDDFEPYSIGFGLPEEREATDAYWYVSNNKTFTLEDVKAHYHDYYYPANMTLKIAGNFDVDAMEKLVRQTYGVPLRNGTKKVEVPRDGATLSGKPLELYVSSSKEKCFAYMGVKYILDDYRKSLILTVYADSLAKRMQVKLRNQQGRTYSVNRFRYSKRDAGLIGVSFDALHDVFDQNVMAVQEQISQDVEAMTPEVIYDAIGDAKALVVSAERDSESLMGLIDRAEHLREWYGVENGSPYAILSSITPDEYQQVLSEAFDPQNRYKYIFRDYYFFANESVILILVFLLITLLLYFRGYRLPFLRDGPLYSERDVVFHRRVRNRLMGFFYFIVIVWTWMLFDGWLDRGLMLMFFGDPYYEYQIHKPFDVAILWSVSLLKAMLTYVILAKTLFSGMYSRIEVTSEHLNLVGIRSHAVSKGEIADIRTCSWSPAAWFATVGAAFMFWKPLVSVEMYDGQRLYLRADKAYELAEDLRAWCKCSGNDETSD